MKFANEVTKEGLSFHFVCGFFCCAKKLLSFIRPHLFIFISITLGSGPKQEIFDVIYGEGNGTPLQYSCLENPMDGGAW